MQITTKVMRNTSVRYEVVKKGEVNKKEKAATNLLPQLD